MTKIRRKFISEIELLYICNDEFREDVATVRNEVGLADINNKYFDVDHYINFDNKLRSNSKFRIKYYKLLNVLAKKYNATDYMDDIESIVEGGLSRYDTSNIDRGTKTRGPIGDPRPSFRDLEAPSEMVGFTVEFVVRGPLLKGELTRWANHHEDLLIAISNDIIKSSKRRLKRLDVLDRLLKTIKYRDDEGLSFAKIADRLQNEMPDDPDVIDGKVNEDSVRKLYNRYRNKYTL